jgi:4-alpha-glucanotransferase
MLVLFQIHYITHFGQQMMLVGSLPSLGNGDPHNARLMSLKDEHSGLWEFQSEINDVNELSYRYFVKDNNFKTNIEEWGPARVYKPGNRLKSTILLLDHWRNPSNPDYALRTSAFSGVIIKQGPIFKGPKVKSDGDEETIILKFKPDMIRIKPGHQLGVSGNAKTLGAWSDKKAIQLGNEGHPEWYGEIKVKTSEFPLQYKYLILDEKGETVFWEKSHNHIIHLPDGQVPDRIEISDEKFDFPNDSWKGVGVAIPVFSLRRGKGFGVGEFTDIKMLVDWAKETGICMIQILPVNDTVARHTWHDSYPYAAISVYALHPIYINISEIGKLKSEINQQIIEAQGNYLNSLAKIDYEAVMVLKSRFYKLMYDESKNEFLNDRGFLSFFEANEHWLKPYAAFSYLRDLFNTPDFSRWGEYSKTSPELLAKLTDKNSEHYDDIAVHYFIQYHAHMQLLDAAEYARSKGVVLKGDIPIGIYRNSVDAWINPHLYHMDCQAGAPPDDFSAKGQNWRFPTYNWEEMAKDNYSWWQQRLRQLSLYFDAFRIDHILGFFRIWEIPVTQVEGLMGYFNPSIPYEQDELRNRGLWFDEKRLCQPYIREHFLSERFGDLTEYVKNNYLVEYAPGCYNMHPDFDTQQKIEEKLKVEPDTSPDLRNQAERIVTGLNSLISEVVFLKAPDTEGKGYFPRHSVYHTRSYHELDDNAKRVIYDIYVDYFFRRNEAFWREKAMTKLPVLKKATNMLLCGEDLGMVPACVPSVMDELGILSLEVQRMPKNPQIKFGYPANYPCLSVATPSSHDTSTIRGWWKENQEQTQRFYNEILGHQGHAPSECTSSIVREIIDQHLYSPSMLAVFPIQDLLGMDEKLRLQNPDAERINQPANPNHYWRYRMHLSLEDLIKQNEFNQFIRDLIETSGRLNLY